MTEDPRSPAPRISIVVPTHDRAAQVAETVGRVLQQSYRDFEIVVVDDGSTDDTRERLAGIDTDRLCYVRQTHRGVSAARNHGARQARGEWLIFLDSDDEPAPRWLEKMMGATDRPGVGIVCCGYISRLGGRTEAVTLPRALGPAFENVVGLFQAGTFTARASLFDDAGGYDETLRYGENTELALRLVPACLDRQATIRSISEPLIVYNRPEPTQRGRERRFHDMLEGSRRTLHRHRETLHRDRGMLADYHGVATVNAARLGKYGLALRHAVSACQARPAVTCLFRLLLALSGPVGGWFWRRHWARG